MAQMVVRNIPDDLMDWLKNQARSEKKSMEQFVKDSLAEKRQRDRSWALERLAEMRKANPRIDNFDVVAAIREDREK